MEISALSSSGKEPFQTQQNRSKVSLPAIPHGIRDTFLTQVDCFTYNKLIYAFQCSIIGKMILISHRGNLTGPNPKRENHPSYILEALNKKFAVEIDVWYERGWWLGHDKPQYKIDQSFVYLTPNLWVHCKNSTAMVTLSVNKLNFLPTPTFFWHETDTHAMTSHPGILCTFPGKPLTSISICVLPERAKYTKAQLKKCLGICSDYIVNYK